MKNSPSWGALCFVLVTLVWLSSACRLAENVADQTLPIQDTAETNSTSKPSSSPTLQPTTTPTSTPTLIPSVTRTPTRAFTRQPTVTRWLTPTTPPTVKPLFEMPVSTPVFIGTPIPNIAVSIDANNFRNLRYIAQWGKGSISAVAFAPSGEEFVVGSAHGYAIYSVDRLDDPPRWMGFDTPIDYQDMRFSHDGNFLLLVSPGKNKVLLFQTGTLVKNPPAIDWIESSTVSENWGRMTVTSPDGQKEFRSSVTYNEEMMDIEYSIREIFDVKSGELLYQLPDYTIYVSYSDYNEPEGCDLHSFSYCGNVYSPNASHPYRVGFSPTGDCLAVLYRPPNLWNSNRFSTLRLYSGDDGTLLKMIGSLEHPVETFAYAPDGKSMVVGFVDGTVQLLRLPAGDVMLSARHFNNYIMDAQYTMDGAYLLIQRPEMLEIRTTKDGSLRSKFDGVTFALSPVENMLAIGLADGKLRVLNIDNGETRFEIEAHKGDIFSLAYSPDGQPLTSSGSDCSVRSWDATSGKFLHDYEENSTNAYGEETTTSRIFINAMQYVDGTNQLIGYGSWARVVSWNAANGATQYLIEPEPLEYYHGMITLNPHFPEFFGIDLDNQSFYVDYASYDLATGERKGEYQPPANLPYGCSPNGPVSSDGSLIFTRGYAYLDGQICVLDAQKLSLLETIMVLPKAVSESYGINWLYLAPTGSQLIVTTYSGVVYVYQIVP